MAKPNGFQDSDGTVGFRKQSLTTSTPFSTKNKDLVIFLVQHFFFFPPSLDHFLLLQTDLFSISSVLWWVFGPCFPWRNRNSPMVEPQARNDKHHKHMFVYVPAGAENDACAVVKPETPGCKEPGSCGKRISSRFKDWRDAHTVTNDVKICSSKECMKPFFPTVKWLLSIRLRDGAELWRLFFHPLLPQPGIWVPKGGVVKGVGSIKTHRPPSAFPAPKQEEFFSSPHRPRAMASELLWLLITSPDMTLPLRSEARILKGLSWFASVWIIFSWSEDDRTSRHPFVENWAVTVGGVKLWRKQEAVRMLRCCHF